jgi:hypothetical protein
MPWRIVKAAEEIPPPGGADATVWRWELADESGAERRTVLVKISGTAMVAEDVHVRVATSRASEGQTEVHRILDWDEPPSEISFHSAADAPDFVGGEPGPEVAELAEVAAWFQERGIVILWTGRGTGIAPETARITTHSANLIDPEADELVARFEAPWRVQAVRDAQRWWVDNKESESTEGRVMDKSGGATATLQAGGRVEVSGEPPAVPHVSPPELETLVRHGRVLWFTEPDPEDPESRWLAEVRDAYSGTIIDFATGYTAEEAYVTIRPSILPPDDRA